MWLLDYSGTLLRVRDEGGETSVSMERFEVRILTHAQIRKGG